MTPDKFTNQEFFLDVGQGHQIYVHDWGNSDAATPVVYLHGGPGNGCDDRDKKKFNPQTLRVIFHDQRGAGKSLPTGELKENTAKRLVEDIEKIADRLELDKFILVGGSWGSTLSLLYAIEHPERVKAMVIDGVYTATKAETEWIDKGGWREFFPDVWEEYAASVPESYRNNPSAYHYKHAFSEDSETAKRSSYAYLKMELALLKLDDRYEPDEYEKFEPGGGKIELHYLANGCFVEEGYISKNAHRLKMPVYLIQGRYDMVCPPRAAFELSKLLPNGKLVWTVNGHLKQHEAKNIVSLLLEQIDGAK